ncbi:DNA methylase [candidate division TA06 bacterium]|nr:DNA methylase [candidate division TA06 bacterium]
MAESLSHKFGQIIGDLLELAIQPHLSKFARLNKLYLDKSGDRKARPGKKVTWIDSKGNKHDLDFVLERGGTESRVGIPVAFIESAWRRYTKHSRNKAQEIQSAIIPLSEKYRNSSPFMGVILAGVFTQGALTQLKSLGFGVLYFPYDTVVKAFRKYGINANFDEKTTEQEFKRKIDSWNKLQNKEDVAKELLRLNKKEVKGFFDVLTESVSRFVASIIILPLHGQEAITSSVTEAIVFLEKYQEDNNKMPIAKYEIIIKYNTGDRIEATFKDRKSTIKFLETYR